MDDRPPVKLDYQTPRPKPTWTWVILGSTPERFVLGLLGGCTLSGIVWWLTWNFFPGVFYFIIAGLILTKVILAYIAIHKWDWSSFAAGIFISIALGGLIMFGTCLAFYRF